MLHFKSHLLPLFPFILRTRFPYKDRLLLNLFFLFFPQTRLHRKKASQMVFCLFLVGVSSVSSTTNDHPPQLSHPYYYMISSYSFSFPSDVCHLHMLLKFPHSYLFHLSWPRNQCRQFHTVR